MRPQQFTNEELLLTAREMFIKHGPGTSIDMIAKELGVSQSAILKRFKTKKELMMNALMPTGVPDWAVGLQGEPTDAPFQEQMEDLMIEVQKFFKKAGPIMSIMKYAGINPHEEMKDMKNAPPVIALNLLDKWLQKCNEKGLVKIQHTRSFALAVLGASFGPNFLEMETGLKLNNIPPEEYAKHLAAMICKGVVECDCEDTSEGDENE